MPQTTSVADNVEVAYDTEQRFTTWLPSRQVGLSHLGPYARIGSMGRNLGTLVLLRHGESDWNAKNLFTGWVDVDLTARGETEARRGGELLRAHKLLPDVAHTSLLRRAIRSAELALDAADRQWIPVRRSWRLNERHYGALQGKNKKQTLETYGEEQFTAWRRSYDVAPPPIADGDEFSQAGDPRYANLPPELMPGTECLKDVLGRTLPYWYDAIVPDLLAGLTVLVVAHGNSLRGIVKHLDAISDDAIAALNIPTGIPLRYDLDPSTLRPLTAGGAYLDPAAAAEAAAAVANQGRLFSLVNSACRPVELPPSTTGE